MSVVNTIIYRFTLVVLLASFSIFAWAEEPLSTLMAVHSLPRELAALGKPVKVRGIVTYSYQNSIGDFAVEDEEAGVYVSVPSQLKENKWKAPLPGALVEITGVTGPGGYAPVIIPDHVEIIGKAWLPTAQPATLNQMLTGRLDSRRVEVRGVVQYAVHRKEVAEFWMELAGEFGRISVFALAADGVEPVDLIDAEVTVRGVCMPFFNERSQVAGVRIEMNSARDIEIHREPPVEPFASPEVSLDRLQPFSPQGIDFHRQRIQGTVTYADPGRFLYLQKGNHAVRVNFTNSISIKPGDRVEVVGFAHVRTIFVEWQRSIVRKTGEAPLPDPIPVTRANVLRMHFPGEDRTRGDYDGRLVSITGRLDKVETFKDGKHQLFVDCDGEVVNIMMNQPLSQERFESLRDGSQVRVTGICIVHYSDNWPALTRAVPVGMHLLSRTPDDVLVLHAASWWNPVRLRIALGSIAAILIVALAWGTAMKRKVARRTLELATETRARRDSEVEFDATLRERERVAVDLHDTVEQALTGVSYQLVVSEALHREEPERSLQHLDLAKQLLAQSREEVRRSVWNLRAQSLSGRALAEVLKDVCAGLSTRNPVNTKVSVSGEERDLPEFIAGHLLLLAQESMTNAIKHASPEKIEIMLTFSEESVEMTVKDDGAGFNPSEAPGLADGHLGLQGMRERMKRLGGTVTIDSSPGKGTEIRARVPLSE